MRSYRHLELSDRFVIFRMINAKISSLKIATALGRDPATVSREIHRNGGRSDYDPKRAQQLYQGRRPATGVTDKFHEDIFVHVKAKLKEGHSPDAIAGRLSLHKDAKWHVSHQTIYNWIHRGALGEPMQKFLLFGKRGYKKGVNPPETLLNQAKKRVDEMPKWAINPKNSGNWEGDTVIGARQKGAILTLAEKKSKYLTGGKLDAKTKLAWATLAKNSLADFDADQLRSMVIDNGSEMNEFQSLEESLSIKIFFAYPGCPWQKPLIENSNRILRRFFPKGMELDQVTDSQVQLAFTTINAIPRKSLNYRTPYEVLFKRAIALGV